VAEGVRLLMSGSARLATAVKWTIAHALYYSGVLRVWQAVALRRKAVVLMYHRVLTEDERRRAGSHPGIVVGQSTFAWQMDLLRRRFSVLSIDDFQACLAGRRPFPPSSCLITFDDGWLDNYTNALPVLRTRGLPAVLFLPVNFIGSRRLFWREALAQLVSRAVVAARTSPELTARLRDRLAPLGLADLLACADVDPHLAVVEAIGERMSALAPVEHQVLGALAGDLGLGEDDYGNADRFMGWSEVEAMAQGGVALGGHGMDHRLLTEVAIDEARAEVRGSIATLASRLGGATAAAFSYPNGCWNAAVASEVAQAGYQVAFTTEGGHVAVGDNAWALRRVNVHEDATRSPALFLARIVGLF
jgi:peptidoglycan/xylan/chitin deacetylase (PgdA/CDA1 family)